LVVEVVVDELVVDVELGEVVGVVVGGVPWEAAVVVVEVPVPA
jgi:hypothetical protein